jgi:hypothetical protein
VQAIFSQEPPAMPPYAEIYQFVQAMAPTWRKTQHTNLAQLLCALLQRPRLCLSELARAWPRPDQPLHGRLKRLMRFLDNRRLDEAALFRRFLKLSYRVGEDLPPLVGQPPLLPILLDTTYFESFAALVAAVPCGSRALPVALTTYHRTELTAFFAPTTVADLSQNQIEELLLAWLVDDLVSAALCPVVVADRGFARASRFRWFQARQRHFVIRIDAETCVQPQPDGAPTPVAMAIALRPGQRAWYPTATYHREERRPVSLLAVWDHGQQAPWYLATTLPDAVTTEMCYRWRMRIECATRDEKTGVLLREGDDHHAIRSLPHLHRLLLARCLAEWLCALVGLQTWRDFPAAAAGSIGAATSPPSQPPPVLPHRGRMPPLPGWMRRFTARGHLSYVWLGLEVLRAPDVHAIVRRLVTWLAHYLWPHTPLWLPWQRRYRRHQGGLAP